MNTVRGLQHALNIIILWTTTTTAADRFFWCDGGARVWTCDGAVRTAYYADDCGLDRDAAAVDEPASW